MNSGFALLVFAIAFLVAIISARSVVARTTRPRGPTRAERTRNEGANILSAGSIPTLSVEPIERPSAATDETADWLGRALEKNAANAQEAKQRLPSLPDISHFAPRSARKESPAASPIDSGDEDEGYDQLVARTWAQSGISIANVTLDRVSYSGETLTCHLRSLVARREGSYYVNAFVDGERKTFVSNNWKWRRDGLAIDDSAFLAIQAGVNYDKAPRYQPYPRSIEEALAPENNQCEVRGRRFVISYLNERGDDSFRVVSGVRRQDERFTAHCHFRRGALRHFLYSRLRSISDAQTGEVIPIDVFKAKGTQLTAKRLQ